jgi:hypothetical protein
MVAKGRKFHWLSQPGGKNQLVYLLVLYSDTNLADPATRHRCIPKPERLTSVDQNILYQ